MKKCNQKDMCGEVYSGAKDDMKTSDGDGDLKNVGKRVILPSPFIGGDRYMPQEYLDSIGLYQYHGHPHGLATMIWNPNWCEISENSKMEKLSWTDQICWHIYSSLRNSN